MHKNFIFQNLKILQEAWDLLNVRKKLIRGGGGMGGMSGMDGQWTQGVRFYSGLTLCPDQCVYVIGEVNNARKVIMPVCE